jgi:hypothetical protein
MAGRPLRRARLNGTSGRPPYTILYEHRSGKRGEVMGLPGTGEIKIRPQMERAGRWYEPLSHTQARVAYWLHVLLDQWSPLVTIVLDSEGNEMPLSKFKQAEYELQEKGIRVSP